MEGRTVSLPNKPKAAVTEDRLVGFRKGMPIPVGGVVVKRALPEEEAILEQYSWKPGDVVPENFSEMEREALLSATDTDRIPLPMDANTPPIDVKKVIKEFDSMSESDKAKYRPAIEAARKNMNPEVKAVLVDSIRQATENNARSVSAQKNSVNFEPGVAAALQELQAGRTDVKETEAKTDEPGAAKQEEKEETKKLYTEQDVDDYVLCLHSGVPFERTYRRFGGRLTITVRELLHYEQRAIVEQVDILRRNVKNSDAVLAFYYDARRALQLKSLSGIVNYTAPASLNAWKESGVETLQEIVKTVEDDMLRGESTVRLINDAVMEFDRLIIAIEKGSNDSDFISPDTAS